MDKIEMWEQFALAGRRLQPLSGASAMLATWMAKNKTLLKPQDLAVLLAIGGALYSAESEEVWKSVTA